MFNVYVQSYDYDRLFNLFFYFFDNTLAKQLFLIYYFYAILLLVLLTEIWPLGHLLFYFYLLL